DAKREHDREDRDESGEQTSDPEHLAETHWPQRVRSDHTLVEESLGWGLTSSANHRRPDKPPDAQRDEHQDAFEEVRTETCPRRAGRYAGWKLQSPLG